MTGRSVAGVWGVNREIEDQYPVNRWSCAEGGLRRSRRGCRCPPGARPAGRIDGGGQAGAGEAGVCLTGAVLDWSDPPCGGSGKGREA